MRQYTDTHEWIEEKEGIATVGLTKRALDEIGEVVHVLLPKLGAIIHKGDDVVVLESTKAAIDISSPVNGEIVAINESLRENLRLLNEGPESSGWLFKVSLQR
jgi:glycine cleavage system H protein